VYARKTLFHLWGALDRGRFNAGVLSGLSALLTFAFITLDGQTGGHMSGGSFAAHLLLMLSLALSLIPLTLRRALDLGWSVPKAGLAVVGSVILFPFMTLLLMLPPGRPGRDDPAALSPLPLLVVLAAPVVGVVVAVLLSLMFSRAL
jgi:hypothetical protein